jgi:hypothetical protein
MMKSPVSSAPAAPSGTTLMSFKPASFARWRERINSATVLPEGARDRTEERGLEWRECRGMKGKEKIRFLPCTFPSHSSESPLLSFLQQ